MVARRIVGAVACLLLAGLGAYASLETAPPKRPAYKNPLGMAADAKGRFAYVALNGVDALGVIELELGQILCEIPVGKKPYDVLLHNGIAYVTCEADDCVAAVNLAERKVLGRFKVGQAPRGIGMDPRYNKLQVVCHDSQNLWTIPLYAPATWGFPATQAKQASQTAIPPQPEGNYARASNLNLVLGQAPAYMRTARPYGLFTDGQMMNAPHIDLATALVANSPRTAFNPTRDLNLAHSGMDLVVHTRPRWFVPTKDAPAGRVFTNALSFFLNGSSPATMVLLDEPDKGYPDPTDIVVQLTWTARNKSALAFEAKPTADNHPLNGSRVFISSGGADTVLVLDFAKAAKFAEASRLNGQQFQFGGWNGGMQFGTPGGAGHNFGNPLLANPFGNRLPGGQPLLGPGGPGAGGFQGIANPNGFQGGGGFNLGFGWQGGFGLPSFSEDLQASSNYTIKRLATGANPRRLLLTQDGKTLLVSNHLSDSLTVIDALKLEIKYHIDLAGPAPDLARQGEILFHGAQNTVQQQFTCASCHPNHGSDGLAWNTSRDGKGETLNSRALHGVRDSLPFGWHGESETLAQRARNTMGELHKHKLNDHDASALAAFLETLDTLRPLPQQGKDQAASDRGKALFHGKASCTRCHRGPTFASATPRAVISDQKNELTPFDVPSLRGVARTAPYLHDGRALTLEEIFQKHNPHHRHGQAHELTPAELSDLVAYLKTL